MRKNSQYTQETLKLYKTIKRNRVSVNSINSRLMPG